MSALHWLSFCDASLPTGSQFLGACIVEGETIVHAVNNAWRLHCNPGGAVKGLAIIEPIQKHIGPEWRNRLLSRTECTVLDSILKPHGVS